MNSSQKLLLSICCLLLVITSCKTKKGVKQDDKKGASEVAKPNNKALLLNQISTQQNTFSYYSANGKALYKDNETKQELGVSIVMEKDKFIYLNVTAILGITVARVLATPDSVVILDMLHRKCIVAKYDFVKKMTNADLKLSNLQNLFAGNTLFSNNPDKCKIDTALTYIIITQLFSETQSQSTMYTQNLKVNRSTIADKLKNQEMKVEYTDVYTQGSNQFPSRFNINIRAEKNIETTFELSNFVFEKKKEIQFTIPKSYETIRM